MTRVVIIGGGFAGSSLAKKLEHTFSTTLIDTKDYFEFTPGILRTIVEPAHALTVQVLHKKYLKKTKLIIGEVREVTTAQVVVDKKKLNYNYLIICSGSRYALPIKEQNVVLATRAEHLRSNYELLRAAKKILIAGGGLVGVELAAEICTHYKDKEITLVHARDRLIERNPELASKIAHRFLTSNGVTIIYSEKVLAGQKKTYHTSTGRELNADLVFMCTGIIPNSEFMAEHFKPTLNEKWYIIVNTFLQLYNNPRIFAVGDVNNLPVEKTAQNAELQAEIVAKNILALERNESLTEYKTKPTPLILSLGKWKGVFISEKTIFSGIIPGLLKRAIEFWFMLKLKWRL